MEKPKSSNTHSLNVKDWPEVAPAHAPLTPEQALALETVKRQAENDSKLLIVRSKALLIATILAVISVAQNAAVVIPPLLRGHTDETIFLLLLSMLVQLCAAGYFLRARDPLFAAQVLRLMMIISALVLFIGLSFIGIMPLTLLTLIFMFSAYKRMDQLKYGRD